MISPVRPVSFEKPRLASARSSSRCALSSNRVCSLLRKARPQGASPANVFEWGRSGELGCVDWDVRRHIVQRKSVLPIGPGHGCAKR